MLREPLRVLYWLLLLAIVAAALLVCINSKNEPAVSASFSSARPIVIIDPGHGGEDGGAVSVTGAKESEINLQISQKLEQLMALCGVPTVLTRNSEQLDYPEAAQTIHDKKVADQKARIQLINSYQNATLISIHQNMYTTSQPSGAQVFYTAMDGSQNLADTIQANFSSYLGTENNRTAKQISDNIYLMKHVTCPAVLVECGFLSNYREEELLRSDNYQLKLVSIITLSYIEFCNLGDTNENKESLLLHELRE